MRRGERINLSGSDGRIQTSLAFARYTTEVGLLHLQTKHALAKHGVRWHMVGSLLVPFFNKLSGKPIPPHVYPAISYLWEFARFTDDLFDNANIFPNWNETKQAAASLQNRLVRNVLSSQANPEQKRGVLHELADLRRRSYAAFERQHGWTTPVSFDEAFAYRKDSSFLLMRKVAAMGNIFAGTQQDKRIKVEDGFEAIGVVALQLPDDLQDVLDDNITNGNLIHAALFDHEESAAFFNAAQNSPDGTNLYKLLANTAPHSSRFITDVANSALGDLKAISPEIERPIRYATQLLFDHFSIDRQKKTFLSKLTRGD